MWLMAPFIKKLLGNKKYLQTRKPLFFAKNIAKNAVFIAFLMISPLNSHAFSLFKPEKSSKQKINSRNYISVVGSSTVYPFTATIAERFGQGTSFKTPAVEATGTGGGIKLFCSGIGFDFPDFVNASRTMKDSELKKCHENGIKNIGEIKIGYDGIVLANSLKGKNINLTKRQIFLALAQKVPQNGKLVANFYKKWSQIDKTLPNIEIRVYGPPATSGTRDAFVELVMEAACSDDVQIAALFANKKLCHIIRDDGAFIEAGENDNLILQKLNNDAQAFGIFGYSFLAENENMIKSAKIDGINPNFTTIINGTYSVSRPLFIYFKQEHFKLVPGMREFIEEIVSHDTLGKTGYLALKGLIPLSNSELNKTRDKALRWR